MCKQCNLGKLEQVPWWVNKIGHLPLTPPLGSYIDLCNIPNFQFGMLYNRSSLHIIFYCIWLILEILRNSRTLGESWEFRYFHISVFSNFENRIIWFYLFYLQLFLLSKYERGNKMTFPKIKKYWGFNKKSNKVLFWFYLLFYLNLGKITRFQKLHLEPKNVHPVLNILFRRRKFVLIFLDFYLFF